MLDDGTIWILDSHEQDAWDDAHRMTFAVLAPDRRLVRDVTLPAPLAGAGAGGDAVAPVDDLGDELLELIMFEIER